MTKPAVNITRQPAPSRIAGRWPVLGAAVMMLVGGLVVAYPFVPAVSYALRKPTPSLPYASKLVAAGRAAPAGLSLPTIGTKPIPKDNRLVIPAIGVDMPIIEGKDEKVLYRGGAWRIPTSSTPDQGGNTVLSGHRWQYRPPSNRTLYLLDKVKEGDLVVVYWRGREYDYKIVGHEVVAPNRVDILAKTDQPRLTIFTCTPLFSTKQRLVLYGQLIS